MTEATNQRALAFDIGGTKLAAAIVESGHCLERTETATPRSGRGEDIVDAMVELGTRLAAADRVGVATTGTVLDGTLTAVNPGTLPIEDGFPLAERLAERLGRPPLIVNDGQAAAWAEYRFGAGVGTSAMAFITVSTGVGGAFVTGDRLHIGRRGFAGHIGHTVADPQGPMCGCGRRGCIEQMASGTAIAATASARYGRPLTAPEVFVAAAAQEAIAEGVLDQAARLLAKIILDSVALLDLDVIVIGGGVGLAPGFRERIERYVEMAPAIFRRPLVGAALGADAGLIGVAQLLDEGKLHLN